MKNNFDKILRQENFSKEDLVTLISACKKDMEKLFSRAREVKEKHVGNKVYFRGLIEFSNICGKNCFYCGIRAGNKNATRYEVKDKEMLEAARYAYEKKFGSIVIQSGERNDKNFINRIDNLIRKIKQLSSGKLGITLSLGEQTEETYRQWFESGAHRYLLRIEVSNPGLYPKYHPADKKHDYHRRLESLYLLRKVGYQVGSGVLTGLPFQAHEDLADDLMFLKDHDIDMVGMGPYIEHADTPLYKHRNMLLTKQERFYLSLKMVATLRLLMKDINIAATTAMQTLDPGGHEKAFNAGANIIMPNLTPAKYRENYLLYNDKPTIDENTDNYIKSLKERIYSAGYEIGYGEWGDSRRFFKRSER